MNHPNELKRLIVEAVYSELPKPYCPEWLGTRAARRQGANEMTINDLVASWFLTPNQEGMRLTASGNHAFVEANLECFVFPIESHFQVGLYGRLLDISKKIKCPYFLGMKKNSEPPMKVVGGAIDKQTPYIRLYDSKIAMMIGLYGSMKEYLESIRRIESQHVRTN